MDIQHKAWNERQKHLQEALANPGNASLALELFLYQHALLHAQPVSGVQELTFDDQLWQEMDDDDARRIPEGMEHSIAWCIWHIARIEDLTMNILVAGQEQLFTKHGWLERLNVPYRDTGNAQPVSDTAQLSAAIDLPGLRQYRMAVGQRTREIVQALSPAVLREKVQPSRIEHIWHDEAVLADGREVVEYWGSRTIAGLLLMPATRHPLVHLNEAMRIKERIQRGER
jgi:hypothetical protein